jgi:hypothetical protein
LSPALADQLVAHPVHHQGRLLRLGLHRNEPHAWPRYRFAAALGGGGVVLVGLDVGVHVLRRHQPHLVAQPGQLARPKMRAAAGLHADQAARQVGEERQHLGPRQPLPQHHPAALIDAMHLEHVLRDVETNRGNLHRTSPPFVVAHRFHLGTRGAAGGVHLIMRPWESLRLCADRRRGFPRSHGPSKEELTTKG